MQTVQILEIVDTRQRDAARKPISGSGEMVECNCCGKVMEVHVILSNGNRIGTTCARKSGLRYHGCGEIVEASNQNYWKVKPYQTKQLSFAF